LRQSARERLLADYSQRLQSLVERNWLLPTGSRSDLSNELLIQLDAEGHVAQVEIARSSGDRAFDRSAVAAVQRASPLPLPNDAALRSDIVRSGFRFVFKPEG
jgi:colicin import membrane protein